METGCDPPEVGKKEKKRVTKETDSVREKFLGKVFSQKGVGVTDKRGGPMSRSRGKGRVNALRGGAFTVAIRMV